MASPERADLAERAEELLAGVRRDAPGAWERLVRHYERLVRSVPREMGLGPADCDDVFQATWTALYEHRERIRRPRALPAWIVSTARRHALHVLRRGAERAVASGSAVPRAVETRDPLEWALDVERREIVHEALKELSPRCRELLGCLYLEPRTATFAETAERLGLAPGSVGPIRNRCLAHLLRVLERRGLPPSDGLGLR